MMLSIQASSPFETVPACELQYLLQRAAVSLQLQKGIQNIAERWQNIWPEF